MASLVIAVVAATAALWFTLQVRGRWAPVGAALIMGLAVSGMHYTGMAALRVHMDMSMATPSGVPAGDFLVPLIVGISGVTLLLTLIIGLSPTEDELRKDRELADKIMILRNRRETTAPSRPEPGDQRAGRWFDGSA